MKEITCNIIKDILPLYIDDIVSNDTKELVKEHIKKCKECRKELENLSNKDYFKEMENENMEEIKTFKKIKSTIKKKIIVCSTLSIVVVLIILCILGYIFGLGQRAMFDDIKISTEIQTTTDGSEEWVIHLTETSGKALRVDNEPVYDSNGYRTGVIINLYSVPKTKLFHESDNYTYGVCESRFEGFEYSVTLKYADEEKTYVIDKDTF